MDGKPLDLLSDLSMLIKILKYTPAQRNSNHLNILENLLTGIRFVRDQVQELGETLLKDMCSKITYEFCPENSFVFDFGSVGDKFYIIIDGTVSVLVPKTENQESLFIKVAELKTGMAFGELALLKDKPRAASIKCLTNCHFAVLKKEDYLRIIGKIESKRLEEKISFLKSLPLFVSWPKRKLERLTYYTEPKIYTRKQLVFQVSSEPTHLYIVKSGEFELSRPTKELSSHSTSLKIAILTKGEIMGEKEIFSHQKFSVNCRCLSTAGELLLIKADNFLLIFGKETSDLLETRKMKDLLRVSRQIDFEEFYKQKVEVKGLKENKARNFVYRKIKVTENKSPTRIRPMSRTQFRAIQKRALIDPSPSSLLPDFHFISFSPSRYAKSPVEMVAHTPGGYFRGKLKLNIRQKKTRSESTDI